MTLQLSEETYINFSEVLCVYESTPDEILAKYKNITKNKKLSKKYRLFTVVFNNSYELEIDYQEYQRLVLFLRDDAIVNGKEISDRVLKRIEEEKDNFVKAGKKKYSDYQKKLIADKTQVEKIAEKELSDIDLEGLK